jgi:hypothetical protein
MSWWPSGEEKKRMAGVWYSDIRLMDLAKLHRESKLRALDTVAKPMHSAAFAQINLELEAWKLLSVSCHWLAGSRSMDEDGRRIMADPAAVSHSTVQNRVAEFLPPAHLLAAFVILAPPSSYCYAARQHHRRLSRTASHRIAALCLLPAFSATTRPKKSWRIGVGEASGAMPNCSCMHTRTRFFLTINLSTGADLMATRNHLSGTVLTTPRPERSTNGQIL